MISTKLCNFSDLITFRQTKHVHSQASFNSIYEQLKNKAKSDLYNNNPYSNFIYLPSFIFRNIS